MNTKIMARFTLLIFLGTGAAIAADAAAASQSDKASELAKKLANPIANLISVPLQYNYDENYGEKDKGSKSQLNNVWSVAGDSNRADISSTFLQPFLAYIIDATKTTLSLNVESAYNWESEEWSVPVNVGAAQLFRVKSQIMQFQLGARYWA